MYKSDLGNLNSKLTLQPSQRMTWSRWSSQCWDQSPRQRCSWGNTSWWSPEPPHTPCPPPSEGSQSAEKVRDIVIPVPCCGKYPHLVRHIVHGGDILLESGNAEGGGQLPLHLLPGLTFQIRKTKLIQIRRSESLANDLYFSSKGGDCRDDYLGQWNAQSLRPVSSWSGQCPGWRCKQRSGSRVSRTGVPSERCSAPARYPWCSWRTSACSPRTSVASPGAGDSTSWNHPEKIRTIRHLIHFRDPFLSPYNVYREVGGPSTAPQNTAAYLLQIVSLLQCCVSTLYSAARRGLQTPIMQLSSQ